MLDNLKPTRASALLALKMFEGKEKIKLLCVHAQAETVSLSHSNSLPVTVQSDLLQVVEGLITTLASQNCFCYFCLGKT